MGTTQVKNCLGRLIHTEWNGSVRHRSLTSVSSTKTAIGLFSNSTTAKGYINYDKFSSEPARVQSVSGIGLELNLSSRLCAGSSNTSSAFSTESSKTRYFQQRFPMSA